MKFILLLGAETPLDLLFLNLFFKAKPEGLWCVGIERGTPFIGKKIKRYRKALIHSGLRFLLFNSMINLPWGRYLAFVRKANLESAKELQEAFGFELFYFGDINSPETVDTIRNFGPFLILNHMPQIIRSPDLFRVAPLGLINIHPGLLPHYQGLGSCLWPLIRGERYHGVTLHFIDSQAIDAGPIVMSGRSAIENKNSVFSLHVKSRVVAAKLCALLVRRICSNHSIHSKPQVGGEYHRLPTKEELKALGRNHGYFLWSDRGSVAWWDALGFEIADETTDWNWVSSRCLETAFGAKN